MAMMAGDDVDPETLELVSIIEGEATRQAIQKNNELAWQLRQQVRELIPTNINNLLSIVQLSIDLQIYSPEDITELGLFEILQDTINSSDTTLDTNLLIKVCESLLTYAPLQNSSLKFIQFSCTLYANGRGTKTFLRIIEKGVADIGGANRYYLIAIPLGEIGLSIDPEHKNLLFYLAHFYQNLGESIQGVELAQKLYTLLEHLADLTYGQALVLRGFMAISGYWQEAQEVSQKLKQFVAQLIAENPPIEEHIIGALANSTFFLPYFIDDPQETRWFHNQMAQLCCSNLHRYYQNLVNKFQELHQQRKLKNQVNSNNLDNTNIDNSVLDNAIPDNAETNKLSQTPKPLKIGYISHCFKAHSVGWLARWIFEHADLEKFEIYTYMACCDPVNNPLHEWYLNKVPKYFKSNIVLELAEKISQDEIDILIDLDSITSDVVYEVLALKPAPVQVTWLGWDASGLPTIDYYIADNYVLPDDAQAYYPEKIWRMPETYIAVDGFEIAVPDLRRDKLDIPADAVVFLSAHTGYKRHPAMVKVQMEIIKGVPGSYFLIKERADKDGIRAFYGEIAQEVGLEIDRLKFMPRTTFEAVHRANLGLADVVLDTYPYNGATTTLETLWMCLPMVTRVGEQFAARNSYTMMVNAGITEGIAWSDEEYIQWGIKLGTDKALRQDIACRLKASRQTAPLWNGKKFTKQMEEAYQQMWQLYLEKE
ncbi:MAG: O-linked N-acetylglucosamine transferase, SPINDLY family protein [Coleofasciculaceae cyanobacterium SM2_1_6]|nr:O-linked N-acetylglucosamine transferase, SPINDLY family protein [Coleofasciculaceae cyanobacterium SM2_1_6]